MSLVMGGEADDRHPNLCKCCFFIFHPHPVVFQLQKLSASMPVGKGGVFPLRKQRMLSTFIGTHQKKSCIQLCLGQQEQFLCLAGLWLGPG